MAVSRVGIGFNVDLDMFITITFNCHTYEAPNVLGMYNIGTGRPGIRGTQVKSSVWMKKRKNHLNGYFWAI